ncbi:MAG: hypothetical protein HRT89_07080 [Lentisphaeria bacterium]|nr:hypothetical protein [Lentisphaeria bacterium]NQZ67816.1 hypothetical protein [Lentisphaeria bacterium]
MIPEDIRKIITDPEMDLVGISEEQSNGIFWGDWRSEDDTLIDQCEHLIETGCLEPEWEKDDLFINYKDTKYEVPLIYGIEDRHITLLELNKVLSREYEIHFIWSSNGSDTVAFIILSCELWNEIENEFLPVETEFAFMKLTEDLNSFTSSLSRPANPFNKWYEFWK